MTPFLAVLAAGAALAAPAPAAQVEPTIISPEDKPALPTVAKMSAAHGWPHRATPAEAAEVSRVVRQDIGLPVMCRPWRTVTAGRWFCDVVVVRVWEDGSFAYITPGDLR